MKKILSACLLLSSFCFSSEKDFNFGPFWEQETHFQKYHCMMIEASIARIESRLEENNIDPFLKSMIAEEIAVIKFNLGLN
jgi:hypothetical protein